MRKTGSDSFRWLVTSAVFSAIFAIGIAVGLALWGKVTLPYHNPWHVVGPVTLESYNPANNNLRFLILLCAPIILLLVAYFACPGRLRDRLFPKEAPTPPEPARKGNALLLTALVLICILAALNRANEYGWGPLDAFHEGESLSSSVSYMHGQAPYKDFVCAHGLFQDPLRAVVAFKLFGRSVGAVRTLESILKMTEFLLLGLAVLILFEGSYLWTFTALALFAIPVFYPFVNEIGDVWNLAQFAVRDLTVFAFLATVLGFKNQVSKEHVSSLSAIIGGFLCWFIPFAAISYSADRGTYLLLACIPLSLILYLLYLRRSPYRMHYLVSSALGVLAGVLLLNALTRGNLAGFVRHVYMIEPKYFGLLNGFVFPQNLLLWKAVLVLSAANAYWVSAKLVHEYHFSGGSMSKALNRYANAYFPELALLVLSLLLFSSAVVRPDWPHMAIGAILPYLLTSVILTRHYLPRLLSGVKIRRSYAGLLAMGLLAWSVYGISCLFSQGLIGKNFPFRVPDSELVPANYDATVQFLKSHLADDEYFFTLTSEGIWYYLMDRPCPSRFSDVFYAAPDFLQKEVVEDLKQKKVKFIIYENDYWTNMIDGIPTAIRLPIIDKYVQENYEPYTMIDDNKICRLKEKPR